MLAECSVKLLECGGVSSRPGSTSSGRQPVDTEVQIPFDFVAATNSADTHRYQLRNGTSSVLAGHPSEDTTLRTKHLRPEVGPGGTRPTDLTISFWHPQPTTRGSHTGTDISDRGWRGKRRRRDRRRRRRTAGWR
jgi:hypothetical protein